MSDTENNSAIAQAASSAPVPPSAYPDTAGIVTNRNDQRDPGDENPESAVEMPGNDAEPETAAASATEDVVVAGTSAIWTYEAEDGDDGAVAEVETVAAAVETEAKKVWNNALQAWV